MALICCPECKREVSDKAEHCPQCGYPIPKYVEHLKAEKEAADALRSRQEEDERKRKIQAEWELQAERKKKLDSTQNPPAVHTEQQHSHELQYEETSNKRVIGMIASGFAIFIGLGLYSDYAKDKNEAIAKAALVAKVKADFASYRDKLKTKHLPDKDYAAAQEALEAISSDMPEYNEAKALLPYVKQHISEVQKKDEAAKAAAEKVRQAEEEKERKAIEDAKYTKAGKRVHAKHPEWDAEDCNTIGEGKIRLGMTKAMVRAAWGSPYRVNTTHASYGTHEQWVMHEMGSSYVYFEDGICTSVQN